MNGNVCGCCQPYVCSYNIEIQSKLGQARKCSFEGFVDTGPKNVYKVQSVRGPTSGVKTTCRDDGPPEDGGEYVCHCDHEDLPGWAPAFGCSGSIADAVTDVHTGIKCHLPDDGGTAQYSTVDLSEIDSTADMVGRANDRLTAADWADVSLGLQFYEPADEESVFISTQRYRVRHAPSATCHVQAWYRETLVPDVGDPIVGAWTSFYTWSAAAPCLGGCTSDTDQCIVGAWQEFDPPDAPGHKIIDFCATCDPHVTDPSSICT